MQSQMRVLKDKLEDAQRNLESNAQMITWLNKQLNEKPGFCGSLPPAPGGFSRGVPQGSSTLSARPPAATFKPSFASIEQLNGGYIPGGGVTNTGGSGLPARATSFERSPSYRTTMTPINPSANLGASTTSSVLNLNTPTSMTSSMATGSQQVQPVNLQPLPKQTPKGSSIIETPKPFTYNLPLAGAAPPSNNKENQNTLNNEQRPPHFVSKYAQ